ncbi:hypothetical protein [Candidatus Palauibacter sp.]|uniref:hypothetical protein n=1 Tax=Candidatus Palauibacter sp. TaxID=3101350 RepID=UPI003B02641C
MAASQQVLPISSESPQCEIVLEEALSLGAMDDPGTIGAPSTITRVGSGDFVLATPENGAEMMVYDRYGRYRESFGRSGEGPGEFFEPGFGVLRPLPDGGLLVLDPFTRRITRLSATWEAVRLTDVGARFVTNFMPLTSGSGFVLAGWGRSDDSERAEITQAIDLDGNTVEMIAVVPTDDAMRSFFLSPLATDGEGRVWRALPTEYAVEAWDPADPGGSVRLEGRPDWFTPGPPLEGYPLEAPAPSVIRGLRYADGLLWITTSVADDEWRDAVADPVQFVPLDLRKMMDGVVEVIDAHTGRLVARAVHDEVLWWTGDKSLLYSIREDGLVPRAVLFSPSLDGEDCPGGALPPQ